MAQAFSRSQMNDIRSKLMASARRCAAEQGVRKTSLEKLTEEAGISKSAFYRFFESKEQLFLAVAAEWEAAVIEAGMQGLRDAEGLDDRSRAAEMLTRAFEKLHEMGIVRFLQEDLPLLARATPDDPARTHYMHSADRIFEMVKEASVSFSQPDSIVLSVIRLLFLSILNIGEVGEDYFPALRLVVEAACDRLIAAGEGSGV